MARRGCAAVDLARQARLSPATIELPALSGRPISARSLALMAAALVARPGDRHHRLAGSGTPTNRRATSALP